MRRSSFPVWSQFYTRTWCRRRQYSSTFIRRRYLFSDSAPLSRDARRGVFIDGEEGGAGVTVGGRTHLSDPIWTSCLEEFLIEIFPGTKTPALALSDVRPVRGAEGMSGDELTNRTSSRLTTLTTDFHAIALVIGHGKRADRGPRGGKSSNWALE